MRLLTRVPLFVMLALSAARADSLTIVNPDFSAVSVQCSNGFAYQANTGGNCAGPNPQQNFNASAGIGWTFSPFQTSLYGSGITRPGTAFSPPPFTGLPFGQAAILQENVSTIAQTITGFVPGGTYTLTFYLGSRYANGCCDGNQTVQASIDNQTAGTWPLASFTPFTLETASFSVAQGGSHTLAFASLNSGDHTAFLSGVTLQTSGTLAVNPPSATPGSHVVALAAGFAGSEAVNLFAYGQTPVLIGMGTADAGGNVRLTGRIPPVPFGSCGLQAVGQTSQKAASGVVAITPRILVNPLTLLPGAKATAQGAGFAAKEDVSVTLGNPPTFLGHIRSGGDGSFPILTFTIPADASPGANSVMVAGQRSGAAESVQILVQ